MGSSVRVRDWFVDLSFTPVAHQGPLLGVIRPHSVAAWIYDFITVEARCCRCRRNSDVLHLASPAPQGPARHIIRLSFVAFYGKIRPVSAKLMLSRVRRQIIEKVAVYTVHIMVIVKFSRNNNLSITSRRTMEE